MLPVLRAHHPLNSETLRKLEAPVTAPPGLFFLRLGGEMGLRLRAIGSANYPVLAFCRPGQRRAPQRHMPISTSAGLAAVGFRAPDILEGSVAGTYHLIRMHH